MDKTALLKNIASTAYNIGFGGKKHLKTYDIYSKFPRFLSIFTIIIGVFQLLNVYKENFNVTAQDIISATLITIGIISLVLDFNGEKKDLYNETGKKLLSLFNELRIMYHTIQNSSDQTQLNLSHKRLQEIEIEASSISISSQALCTNLLTHHGFFAELQSDWVSKELGLTWKDKFPRFHWESLLIYLFLICLVYILLKKLVLQIH